MKFEHDRGGTELMPLLPLRDIVMFPYMIEPLFVGRKKSIAAIEEATRKDNLIFLSTQVDSSVESPAQNDIYAIGCVGKILQSTRTRDGAFKILIEGLYRGKVKQLLPSAEYFLVYVERLDEDVSVSMDTQNIVRVLLSTVEEYLKFKRELPPTLVATLSAIENPGRLVDTLVKYVKEMTPNERQGLLETLNATERLNKLYRYLKTIVEKLNLEAKIKSRLRKGVEQRGGIEPSKMGGIPGQDEFKSDLEELEEAIKNKKMPPEVSDKVWSEFRKLKLMSPLSAEATVVRNYIDTVLGLPWFERTEEKLDLAEAGRILEEDHYGLKKVKERILEYLAVRALVDKMKGPILCFVGPPGVGKTSLGRSIARATGRKFVRVSLGGVRDEAEIRGHRRTYIGSMPGKVISGMKRVGVRNPVFLLDEVDKMSSDWRGDPASALLEVLDPEQNFMFQDHYVEVDYDLSEVMFITTANTMHGIPAPLLDRMEVIRLPGYTEEEQLEIGKQFLVPKQRNMHGLAQDEIAFTDHALLTIIRYYTREAGVRKLEREIASICRKVAREVVASGTRGKLHKIAPKMVSDYLGVPRFRLSRIEECSLIGLCTGLAWTDAGGEILATEVTVMPGKGKVLITGKLGEVMQESAQAALSYIRSRSVELGIDPEFYQKVDIHIHVPEGAIPKDGPSAGITIATAIASALMRIPVKHDLAMTGEITLRGRVLPIGGLKEKIIAALRGGVKEILIPKENERELEEIPKQILKQLKIVFVENMDHVLMESLIADDPKELFKRGEKMGLKAPDQFTAYPDADSDEDSDADLEHRPGVS